MVKVFLIIFGISFSIFYIIIYILHLIRTIKDSDIYDWGNLFIFFTKMKSFNFVWDYDEERHINNRIRDESVILTPLSITFRKERKELGMIFDPIRYFVVFLYISEMLRQCKKKYKNKIREENRKRNKGLWRVDETAKRMLKGGQA